MARQPRNPPWQRDELILALDLYFRHNAAHISNTHEEIIRLSEVLKTLPIHSNHPDATKFRNPNGVYMKLSNFLRYDPDYSGSGLTHGGKLEEQIWHDFADDTTRLRKVAQAIIDGRKELPEVSPSVIEDDEEEFPEGRVLYRLHRKRERNRSLVKKAKQRGQQKGHLKCVVCGFDYFEEYGEIGMGFVECHHTVPVSEYVTGQRTRVQDIALVCANCHRMLHRRRPWLTVDKLSHLRKAAKS